MMPEMDSTNAAAISQDLSSGYCVEIYVTSEGYRVKGPTPIEPDEEPMDTRSEDVVPTITDALKHVLSILKTHPIDQGEQTQLEAGYSAGRGR